MTNKPNVIISQDFNDYIESNQGSVLVIHKNNLQDGARMEILEFPNGDVAIEHTGLKSTKKTPDRVIYLLEDSAIGNIERLKRIMDSNELIELTTNLTGVSVHYYQDNNSSPIVGHAMKVKLDENLDLTLSACIGDQEITSKTISYKDLFNFYNSRKNMVRYTEEDIQSGLVEVDSENQPRLQ